MNSPTTCPVSLALNTHFFKHTCLVFWNGVQTITSGDAVINTPDNHTIYTSFNMFVIGESHFLCSLKS